MKHAAHYQQSETRGRGDILSGTPPTWGQRANHGGKWHPPPRQRKINPHTSKNSHIIIVNKRGERNQQTSFIHHPPTSKIISRTTSTTTDSPSIGSTHILTTNIGGETPTNSPYTKRRHVRTKPGDTLTRNKSATITRSTPQLRVAT